VAIPTRPATQQIIKHLFHVAIKTPPAKQEILQHLFHLAIPTQPKYSNIYFTWPYQPAKQQK
jgi:hypothetical protein